MRKPFVPSVPDHMHRFDTADRFHYRLALMRRRHGWGWRGRSPHRHRKEGRA